jgi:hypothetical protein
MMKRLSKKFGKCKKPKTRTITDPLGSTKPITSTSTIIHRVSSVLASAATPSLQASSPTVSVQLGLLILASFIIVDQAHGLQASASEFVSTSTADPIPSLPAGNTIESTPVNQAVSVQPNLP